MKERLLLFIEYLDITPAAFERNVSLSNGFVANLGDSVREKTIAKISVVYPELNINWWKTGEGTMLIGNKHKLDLSGDYIRLSHKDIIQILKIQTENHFIQKELLGRLKTAQQQVTESQAQITLLLKKRDAK